MVTTKQTREAGDGRPEVLSHLARVPLQHPEVPALDSGGRTTGQRQAVVGGGGQHAGQQAVESAVARAALPEHAQEKGGEQRGVHEGEHQLEHVHDVVELARDVRRRDADEDAEDRGHPADPDIVAVALPGTDVALVDIVRPHGVERRHVAGHARHERGQQGGQSQTQHPGGQEAPHQQGHGAVVVQGAVRLERKEVAASARAGPGRSCRAGSPGTGKNIFGTAAMSGVRRAADIESAAIARCTIRKSVHQ